MNRAVKFVTSDTGINGQWRREQITQKRINRAIKQTLVVKTNIRKIFASVVAKYSLI